MEHTATERPEWFSSPKINDLQRREWRYRVIRGVRHALRCWSRLILTWGDEPRVWRAWRRGWDDEHFIQLIRLRDQGFRPKVIYDIGANVGAWSTMCQALFAPQAIYLFEPQAQCLRAIERCCLSLKAPWKIIPAALGDESRELTLNITHNRAASSLLSPKTDVGLVDIGPASQDMERVQVKRLDDLAEGNGWPPPDLVKIDVQGFEKQVMEGGGRTLAQARYIVVEVSLRPLYEGQALLPEILSAFVRWGFDLVDINETLRRWPAGELWQVDLWLRGQRGR